MKRILLMFFIFVLVFLTACSTPPTPPQVSPPMSPVPSLALEPTPEPTAEPTPEPTTEPTPTDFGEVPDSAGSGNVLFDIYVQRAKADLDADGIDEQIEFIAAKNSSVLTINGMAYTLGIGDLAQLFALTDVDSSDNILELAFTDKHRDLADSEAAFTYLYWWTGTNIVRMGDLRDVKFDGAWRSSFDPAKYFDAKGLIKHITRSEHLTDIWYTGHYKPSGSDRKLKEDSYVAKPLYNPGELVLRDSYILLKKIDSKYFKPEYYVMWDKASGMAMLDRDYSDDIISFVPQAGETLKITRVYGKNWFRLSASDGKYGWLKCVDSKLQGYHQVMGFYASDMFDGIIIAG